MIVGIYADVTERNGFQREIAETSETLRAILDASPLPIMVVDLERRTTYWNRASDEAGRVAALLGVHEDLRARRELETQLRDTASLLTAILDASPLAIMAVDEQMRVTYWNPAAEQLYGWTAGEILGQSSPLAPPLDPDVVLGTFRRIREGGAVGGETTRGRRDGSSVDVRIHNTALLDADGRFRGAVAIHGDVTEQKRLEAELLQAQKMETVGRLAGGVAHDFNNILTAIIGYADLATSLTSEPEARHALSTIKASGERAAGLTQQLLAFSRRQVLQPKIVDANDVVHAMESMLRRLIGEDIELLTAIAPDAGSLLVDRTQLEQVILNLAVNARDAMPSGGRLAIRTERARINGDHQHLEMPSGEYVVISVADTGLGMDEETRAHIFEPFFTTRSARGRVWASPRHMGSSASPAATSGSTPRSARAPHSGSTSRGSAAGSRPHRRSRSRTSGDGAGSSSSKTSRRFANSRGSCSRAPDSRS